MLATTRGGRACRPPSATRCAGPCATRAGRVSACREAHPPALVSRGVRRGWRGFPHISLDEGRALDGQATARGGGRRRRVRRLDRPVPPARRRPRDAGRRLGTGQRPRELGRRDARDPRHLWPAGGLHAHGGARARAVAGGPATLEAAAPPPPRRAGGPRGGDTSREGPPAAPPRGPGARCGELFPAVIGDPVRATRQEVFFFGTPPGDARFTEEALPVWADHANHFMYGIPGNEWRGFKVADDARGPVFDPTAGERVPSPEALRSARDYLAFRFPALKDAPLVEARVCQYENSPDEHFIIDRHPAAANAWLVGGGSGHGFKHGPALGELVAGLVLKDATPDAQFRLSRLKP